MVYFTNTISNGAQEGNYVCVEIGDQTWMSENLSVDDGGEGIYHHNGETYYTWDAAMRVCSNLKGWHLPSKDEWKTLFKNCGGKDVAGLALKSTSGWRSDGNGEDSFGFSALPAGGRDHKGLFYYDGNAYFWSSTESGSDYAYSVHLYCYYDEARLDNDGKNYGFSVRCIKDKEG